MIGCPLPERYVLIEERLCFIALHHIFGIVVDPDEIYLLCDDLQIPVLDGEIDAKAGKHIIRIALAEERLEEDIGIECPGDRRGVLVLLPPGCWSWHARVEYRSDLGCQRGLSILLHGEAVGEVEVVHRIECFL